jgi:hypothetical protein
MTDQDEIVWARLQTVLLLVPNLTGRRISPLVNARRSDFEVVGDGEVNRGDFRGVIDRGWDDKVTRFRRVWRVVVKRWRGADDGYHGAPFSGKWRRYSSKLVAPPGCLSRSGQPQPGRRYSIVM